MSLAARVLRVCFIARTTPSTALVALWLSRSHAQVLGRTVATSIKTPKTMINVGGAGADGGATSAEVRRAVLCVRR